MLVDSSTGDRFNLTGRPSGHTASIVLPANLGEQAPAQTGPRASYAAILATPVAPAQDTPAKTPGTASGGCRRRPYAGNHPGHSGPFSGRAQPGNGAASDIMRCGPLPQHLQAADRIRDPVAGHQEVSGGKEGVPCLGSSEGSMTLHKPVGVPPAHGEEGGRVLHLYTQQVITCCIYKCGK